MLVDKGGTMSYLQAHLKDDCGVRRNLAELILLRGKILVDAGVQRVRVAGHHLGGRARDHAGVLALGVGRRVAIEGRATDVADIVAAVPKVEGRQQKVSVANDDQLQIH